LEKRFIKVDRVVHVHPRMKTKNRESYKYSLFAVINFTLLARFFLI